MTPDDELIATRRIAAPRADVWRAFTTAEHLAAFWGGRHATVPPESVAVDLRVGGELALDTVGPHGNHHRLTFRYEVVDEPSLLVLAEPRTGITTEIRLDASDDGAATTVVVHQRRLPVELRTEQAANGLAGILDRLAETLEGARP